MKRTATILIAAAMLAVPASASAKPSLDKRIKAIAHRVAVLEAENAELRSDNAVILQRMDDAQRDIGGLVSCLYAHPFSFAKVTLAPDAEGLVPFESLNHPTWLVAMRESCTLAEPMRPFERVTDPSVLRGQG